MPLDSGGVCIYTYKNAYTAGRQVGKSVLKMGEQLQQQEQQKLVQDIGILEKNKQETETEEQQQSSYSYSWPVIRFDVSAPHRTYHFYNQFRTNPSNPNNFLKSITWFVMSPFVLLLGICEIWL